MRVLPFQIQTTPRRVLIEGALAALASVGAGVMASSGSWHLVAMALLVIPMMLLAAIRPQLGIYLLALSVPLGLEFDVGTITSSGGERIAYATITRSDVAISLFLYDFLVLSLWLGWLGRGLASGELNLYLDQVSKLALAFWALTILSLIVFGSGLQGRQFLVSLIYAFKLLEVISVYILVRNLLPADRIRSFITVFLCAGVIAGVIGVYTMATGNSSVLGLTIVQDRISYFGFLVLAAPIALALTIRVRTSDSVRLLCWLVVALSIILTLWNGKTALVMGLGAAMGFLLVHLGQWRWAVATSVLVLVVMVFSPLGGIAADRYLGTPSGIPFSWAANGSAFAEEAALLDKTPLGDVVIDASVVDRTQKLLAGIRELQGLWWRGMGYWTAIYRLGFDPHNFFIRLVLEMGVLGLVLFALLMRSILRRCQLLSRSHPDISARYLAGGVLAATVGYLVMALTGDIFYVFQLMASYWLALGVVNARASSPNVLEEAADQKAFIPA